VTSAKLLTDFPNLPGTRLHIRRWFLNIPQNKKSGFFTSASLLSLKKEIENASFVRRIRGWVVVFDDPA